MKRSLIILLVAAAVLASGVLASPAFAMPKSKEQWVMVESPHFTFYSNTGRKSTENFAMNLERLRDVLEKTIFGAKFNSPVPGSIFVFRSEKSFGPYKIGKNGKPAELVGYFISATDGNYLAFDASADDQSMAVIYHEYLHDFVRNNLPDLPLWFNEGLAEFYSTFQVREGRAEIGRTLQGHIRWLGSNPLMSMDEMFAMTPDSSGYHGSKNTRTFYAQSWALTHMFLTVEEYAEHTNDWIRLISAGQDPLEAMTTAFGMGQGEIAGALRKYIQNGNFIYTEHTFEKDLKLHQGSTESASVPRAEILYRLGDLLVHHRPVQVLDAEEHLRTALKLDAGLADAHVSLGLLKEEAGREAEAVQEYEVALYIDPNNVRGLTLLGHNRLNLFIVRDADSVDPEDGTPTLLVEARALFQRALQLSPDNPETLAGFGKTFFYDQGDLNAGIVALSRAAGMLPSRTDILYDLIVLHAAANNAAAAKEVLDRALRRRAEDDLIAAAEDVVVNIYVRAANHHAARGELAQAVEVLKDGIRQTRDPLFKKDLQASVDQIMATAASNQLIEQYNAAVSVLNSGDLATAQVLFEQLLEIDALDPDLKTEARNLLATTKERMRYEQHVEALAAALQQAARGELQPAIAAVRKILDEDPDPTIRVKAEDALAFWNAQD
jgi:tetratricopeptide (TPR) repeat protein